MGFELLAPTLFGLKAAAIIGFAIREQRINRPKTEK